MVKWSSVTVLTLASCWSEHKNMTSEVLTFLITYIIVLLFIGYLSLGDIFRSDQTLTTRKMIEQNYGKLCLKLSDFGCWIKSGSGVGSFFTVFTVQKFYSCGIWSSMRVCLLVMGHIGLSPTEQQANLVWPWFSSLHTHTKGVGETHC